MGVEPIFPGGNAGVLTVTLLTKMVYLSGLEPEPKVSKTFVLSVTLQIRMKMEHPLGIEPRPQSA